MDLNGFEAESIRLIVLMEDGADIDERGWGWMCDDFDGGANILATQWTVQSKFGQCFGYSDTLRINLFTHQIVRKC